MKREIYVVLLFYFNVIEGFFTNQTFPEAKDESPGGKHFEKQIDNIWENILNQERILNEPHKNLTHYLNIPPGLGISSTMDEYLTSQSYAQLYDTFVGGSNVVIVKRILEDLFSEPRFTNESRTRTANQIFERLSLYTIETQKQHFKTRQDDGKAIEGTNIIGIIPGRNRGEPENGLIVIGAHYDTVENSAGVDDNGSGMVALLETARLLSPKMGKFNNSIMFVAFDLMENGILGSLAFVNQFLIPMEIVKKRTNFVGAYILDSVMNFDASSRSQLMPLDVLTAVPEARAHLQANSYKGDFMSVWSRRVVDWDLWYPFQKAWKKEDYLSEHKLLIIDPPIPRVPLLIPNWRYRSFMRSDHAAFWSHKNNAYKDSLKAVLLTDMGPWRGTMRICYHEFCDDRRLITLDNLEFLKHLIDTLAAATAILGAY